MAHRPMMRLTRASRHAPLMPAQYLCGVSPSSLDLVNLPMTNQLWVRFAGARFVF